MAGDHAVANILQSIAAPSKAPRSILKPTIPLQEIPPLKKKRKDETDLIDFGEFSNDNGGSKKVSAGETNGSKVALRTEEEQQAAAREREERERRDARRKSLANRRVSFAAEATLHTFHEVEFPPDSTTSTDSTRRNSAIGGKAGANSSGRESTPQDQLQDALESPDNQRELHQRKRRRSSGAQPLNYSNPDDDTATSILYSSDSEPPDAVEEVADVEDEDSNSDSDDGTMMSIDTEEVTGTTVASERSAGSADDSSTLDEVLRLAARRAGTQRLDEESDDGSDGEEFIPSFGWGKNNNAASGQENMPSTQQPQSKHTNDDGTEMEMDMDMDMTQAVGGILKAPTENSQPEPEEEMSMDVTRAFGGIVQQNLPDTRNQDQEADDDNENDGAPMDDATMEMTTAIGGIRRPVDDESDASASEDYEDMSMELTTVLGGVLSKQKRKSIGPNRRKTLNKEADTNPEDATMDMTVGLGRIVQRPDNEDLDEDNEGDDNDEATMGMDMTAAIGSILNKASASPRTLGKRILEEEVDTPNNPEQAVIAAISRNSPAKEKTPEPISPGLSAFHGKGLRRSMGPQASTTPKSATKSTTPTSARQSGTPQSASRTRTPSSVKAATPQLRSSSPIKTTPGSQTRRSKSASPTRAASARTDAVTPSPAAKSAQRRSSVFRDNSATGSRTPTVVLTPQSRRLSGVGADRSGLGSPRVAALFDRRSSIGEAATDFIPGKRIVSFQDPQSLSEEVDKERHDQGEKEDGRSILEREADGSAEEREATLNLREMIDSMSPKRKPLKGRKSLHVGSARGLLGKRPSELDEEEEAEENDGVKRLKGHQGSPVKNVKLQQPPSKEETTGRLRRSLRKSLAQSLVQNGTPTLSPIDNSPATTPRNQARFKDVENDQADHQVDFNESSVKHAEQLEQETDEDRIHLQEFLNLTSIRFMELTTTKRRHTQAPGSFQDGFLADGKDDLSLERCVVAGACTVPMLELYQHSCRELKKYISEGRGMVKEIETETFEENPPLFKEYMSASSEVKALMDNQFKNVKTHARLLSKAMWYEWRMKLQDGLKEGLLRIAEGMDVDEESLQKQKDLLTSVMPKAVAHYESLVEQCGNLEEVAKELADCDPEELEAAREDLSALTEDVEQKQRLIAELRLQFEASEAEVEELKAQKQQCLDDISEAEKIREECRGWTSTEVNTLKGNCPFAKNH